MKKLPKIIGIVLFVIVSVSIQAENIDECKSDLYFANGIMMKYSEKDALDMWKEAAGDLLVSKPEIYAKIANIKMSYNISQGFLDDVLESFEQVMSNEWGWVEFSTFFEQFLTTHNIQEDWVPHIKDLLKQTKSYKDSIKLGHNVIVVAHSQGNYYTNEAYDLLDGWMKPYFHMMGVATPANHVADDGPYVKFHNDFIKFVVTGLPSNRMDLNSNHNQTFSIAAHDFYESYLSAVNTRSDIEKFIFNKVKEHAKAPTQWETDQEFERNTCNYRITLKHRFDPSIEVGGKVYPFNGSKKLYQAKNKDGVLEYVKASCGGKNISDEWEGKKENECWMIDNVEKEKIVGKQRFIRDDDKEVVLDTNTSLVWQDNIIVSKQWITIENWLAGKYFDTSGDTATTYCENLALGGYADWRLPSVDELKSISLPFPYRSEQSNPTLAFDNYIFASYYWSSTTYANGRYAAWIVNFNYGNQGNNNKYDFNNVRCVRAGQ